ncbi:class I SAM-dependent methyltransferase, partial [Bacteroidota bacterium]
FNGRKVLDLGCSYGQFLVNFDSGSLGVDLQDRHLEFAVSLDLQVVKFNVEEGVKLGDKYDVVFCRQLLDHLVSPHKLLVESHRILEGEGFLIVAIDNIDYLLGGAISEHHLYGFNLKVLRMLVERSGFNIIKAFTLTSNKPRLLEKLINSSSLLLSRSMDLYVIAKRDAAYRYPERRLPWFSPSWLVSELDRHNDEV